MRASKYFSSDEVDAVAKAVRAAESLTAAEIVPVAATASGRYDRAEDVFGLLCATAAVALCWTLFQGAVPAQGDWASGHDLLFPLKGVLAVFIAGFGFGTFAATFIPSLKRPFVGIREMEDEVERSAQAAFHRLRVSKTRGGTGVLIYVSLFERRVRILGDQTVHDALSQAEFDAVRDLLVDGIRRGRAGDGFCEVIARCGSILGRSFPPAADDTNELDNGLRLID